MSATTEAPNWIEYARVKATYEECHRELRTLANKLASDILSFGGRYERADCDDWAETAAKAAAVSKLMADAEARRITWTEARTAIWALVGAPGYAISEGLAVRAADHARDVRREVA